MGVFRRRENRYDRRGGVAFRPIAMTNRNSRLIFISFFVVLAVAFLLRLEVLQGPFRVFYTPLSLQDDYHRDHLVARHIVAYQEYPRAGPDSSFTRYLNSPAYFYLLALPLFVSEDFMVLGIFNLALQLAALVLVFALARTLFGNGTALLADALFGFHQRVLGQSNWMWQPNAMQPFLLLGYLLLALAYQKKSFAHAIASVPVVFFALALHASVLAIVPLYILFLGIVLRHLNGTVKQYAITAAVCVSSLVVFYAPLFAFAGGAGIADFLGQMNKDMLAGISESFTMFSRYILFSNVHSSLQLAAFLSTLFIAVFHYFFRSGRDPQRKLVNAVLAVSLAWFLFAASVLPETGKVHYFIPVLGLSVIFVAEIIDGLRKYSLKAAAVVAVLFFTAPMSFALVQKMAREGIPGIASSYRSPPFILAMRDLVLEMKEAGAESGEFGFRFYKENADGKYAPAGYGQDMFWNSMEMELGSKLTKIDDSAYRSYHPLMSEEYVFVACDGGQDASPCLDVFLKDRPGYELRKEFRAEPYQMYLMK